MSETKYLTISESLSRIIDAALSGVNSGLPAKVLSYNKDDQTVEVEIQHVDKIEKDGLDDPVERGVEPLPDVPVLFPRSGVFSITWPLKKGDDIFLVFSQRSTEEWYLKSGDGAIDPKDKRRHDLSDAFAIPGPPTDKTKLKAHAVSDSELILAHDNGTRLILGDDNKISLETDRVNIGSKSASNPAAVGSVVKSQILAIQVKVDAMGTILGLPPLVLTGEINSGKLFTND
jgi:hypothetical protein